MQLMKKRLRVREEEKLKKIEEERNDRTVEEEKKTETGAASHRNLNSIKAAPFLCTELLLCCHHPHRFPCILQPARAAIHHLQNSRPSIPDQTAALP
jgi:hypothetical protein